MNEGLRLDLVGELAPVGIAERAAERAALDRELLDDADADDLLRLLRRAGDVRRRHHGIEREQRVARGRRLGLLSLLLVQVFPQFLDFEDNDAVNALVLGYGCSRSAVHRIYAKPLAALRAQLAAPAGH